jgi:hypothetical protein
MTALIDIDGCLADFAYSYRVWHKKIFNPKLEIFPVGQRPFKTWSDPDIPADEDKIMFQKITMDKKAAFKFWENLPSLVDDTIWKRLNALSNRGKIYFVSNRWGPWAHWYTKNWLVKQGIERPSLILAGRKSLIAIAVKAKWALDDKWENVWDMKPYCHSCLLEKPYNMHHSDPSERVGRVKTVAQFLRMIEKREKPSNVR